MKRRSRSCMDALSVHTLRHANLQGLWELPGRALASSVRLLKCGLQPMPAKSACLLRVASQSLTVGRSCFLFGEFRSAQPQIVVGFLYQRSCLICLAAKKVTPPTRKGIPGADGRLGGLAATPTGAGAQQGASTT